MDPRSAVLRTIAPSSQEFKCISLPYSMASTSSELIYVGHGTPDSTKPWVMRSGKIVMANAKSPSYYRCARRKIGEPQPEAL